jgi:SAM-dependent methyltransferase
VLEAGGSHVANATQMRQWNGEIGRYWIAHRERHVAAHRYLLTHLFGAAQISAGERVLDVGCGCGATTITAARAAGGGEHSSGGRAVGLDVSGPMLRVARRLAAQADLANVGFIQGDAQSCPLRQDSCDVVISSFGVMFFDDAAEALRSIATVLRHHGRLAFLCWQDDMNNEFTSIPLRAFGTHTRLPTPAGDDQFYDPQQITKLLSGAGWEEIQIDAVCEPAWMGSDVADVMTYVCGMPVVRSLATELSDESLTDQVLATIAEQYAARQRLDGVWVRAAAWLVTARRA